MIGVYQSDIEFRKVAFVSMQDAFYSFMSINGDTSQMYFDESQVELINYLSKHGINKLVKRVLDTIKNSIPDIQITLIHAIISIAGYVNNRDTLIFILEQLIQGDVEGRISSVILQATSEEILTIIRSLIHFVVKYPEISDQAMNILKQMTKSTHQSKQIDILYLCFKECLSLMQMKIYETHTIIFILNSFSISSDDLQYKTILFLINSLFFEVFMKGVARVEESSSWSSHVHDHQLELDSSLLE